MKKYFWMGFVSPPLISVVSLVLILTENPLIWEIPLIVLVCYLAYKLYHFLLETVDGDIVIPVSGSTVKGFFLGLLSGFILILGLTLTLFLVTFLVLYFLASSGYLEETSFHWAL